MDDVEAHDQWDLHPALQRRALHAIGQRRFVDQRQRTHVADGNAVWVSCPAFSAGVILATSALARALTSASDSGASAAHVPAAAKAQHAARTPMAKTRCNLRMVRFPRMEIQ
jgi:hypothetical protein